MILLLYINNHSKSAYKIKAVYQKSPVVQLASEQRESILPHQEGKTMKKPDQRPLILARHCLLQI